MIHIYFDLNAVPAGVALFLEEAELSYEAHPVDRSKAEHEQASFREVNPEGELPLLIDPDGPEGREVRVFDATAVLIYLAKKTGLFIGPPDQWQDVLSWLLFISNGISTSAENRSAGRSGMREPRETERHLRALNDHIGSRISIIGESYTVADIAAWGWLSELWGTDARSPDYPNLSRMLDMVASRPAAMRARNPHWFAVCDIGAGADNGGASPPCAPP
jgi:GSH-dependent disulfide-bond oxidoreductase